jgi:hypothetical protein
MQGWWDNTALGKGWFDDTAQSEGWFDKTLLAATSGATTSINVPAFAIASAKYAPTVATTANFSLVATGSQITLAGGSSLFGISLVGSGSQITLTGGNATLDAQSGLSLTGTGTALALTGGTADLSFTANVALVATGSALALTGGTAGLTAGDNKALVGSGSQVSLTGGTADLSYTANLSLVGTGSQITLSGGNASLLKTDNIWLSATGSPVALLGGTADLVADVDINLLGEGSALSLVGGNAALEISSPQQDTGGGGFVRVSKSDTKKTKEWLRRRSAKPVSLRGRAGRISLRGAECGFYTSRPVFIPNMEAIRPPLRFTPKAKALPVVKIDYAAIERKRAEIRLKARRKRDEEFLLFIA